MKLDVKVKSRSNLKLKPISDGDDGFKYGGFVPAVLKEVNFSTQTYEKGEYEGKDVPVLTFVFENYNRKEEDPLRVHIHSEKIPPTLQKEGESYVAIETKKVEDNIQDMWKRIKHILEECYTSNNFRSIEELKAEEIEEYFVLPSTGKVDDRLAAFTKFFNFIVDFVNGKGKQKSILVHKKVEDGIPMWLKLVTIPPSYNRYAFSRWVGTGFIEAMLFDASGKPKLPERLELSPSDNLHISKQSGPRTASSVQSSADPGSEAESVVQNLGVNLD